ncbi:hypothetical protein [Natranaerobius trueperi]|uniref:NadR/Ttd14 AAA domain-containing protein n=1 Tax=Natranaerobius trueperi TaxID=759412 RepID=A0A226BZR1_9FIRM|nr:hypothetical protein [Natranaerobius trueperi]OWZ83610.1 hypothetical protein CDO51_07825 [Natranaerobius trueperi]
MNFKSELIGVCGNCASGKTTLVDGLLAMGYQAVNIPQEHSVSKTLWKRKNPDFLVVLICTLKTAKKRRNISWGEERLRVQRKRLSDAIQNCNLYLPTDDLTIPDVLLKTVASITKSYEQKSMN